MSVDRWASDATRAASPATWWLLRLLLPARGRRIFYGLYAYFRWADDTVDAPGRDPAAVRRFGTEQRRKVAELLDARGTAELPPERALASAIAAAGGDPWLRTAVERMWEALGFDAERDGTPITEEQLEAQIARVGDAYTAALLMCLDVREAPPGLWELARAATAVHHLRDLLLDLSLGYRNVPASDAARFGFDPASFTAEEAEPYVRERRVRIRAMHAEGLRAVANLPTLRARLLFRAYAWRYRVREG